MSRIMNFYLFPVFTFILFVCAVNCNVPVLLWESSSISDKDDLIPALYQLDSDEFSNHVIKKVHVHKPLVVLFLEESLSVEDFSWKDDHGQGSFPQLKNLTSMSAKTEFITSVYDPLAALKDLAESQDYTWVKYDGKKLPVKSRAVLEVRLEDPLSEEDRPELLLRHDQSIAKIYSQLLSKYSHIVALFTGKYSSWVEPDFNRVKREIDENATLVFDLSTKFSDDTYSMIMSNQLPILKFEESKMNLSNPQNVLPDMKKGQNSIVAIFQDKIHLRFTFTQGEGYWKLTQVILNNNIILKPSVEITAPIGSPFKTDKPVEFTVGTTKLLFQGLLAQAFSANSEFGENAPVYFTYPILMGIFVSAILGIILSWAIIMMMDIRTMDRFDDPKGKTITVTQAE